MFIYMESSQFFFTEHKITDDIVSVSFTVSILNSTFHPSTHGSSKENSLLEKKTTKNLRAERKKWRKKPKEEPQRRDPVLSQNGQAKSPYTEIQTQDNKQEEVLELILMLIQNKLDC